MLTRSPHPEPACHRCHRCRRGPQGPATGEVGFRRRRRSDPEDALVGPRIRLLRWRATKWSAKPNHLRCLQTPVQDGIPRTRVGLPTSSCTSDRDSCRDPRSSRSCLECAGRRATGQRGRRHSPRYPRLLLLLLLLPRPLVATVVVSRPDPSLRLRPELLPPAPLLASLWLLPHSPPSSQRSMRSQARGGSAPAALNRCRHPPKKIWHFHRCPVESTCR
mmetsp:Transcript_10394/g.22900  ORF Transcript_10394/g.22900 Transcript_10394/m.22900 type:complete len:219 (-) Transcript_10394:678-1334(-)